MMPLLSLIIWLPAIAALFIAVMPRNQVRLIQFLVLT